MESSNNISNAHPEFLADYELSFTQEELQSIEMALNEEEEKTLNEILKLQEKSKVEGNFMQDMLNATKQGALNYLESFTDTSDTLSNLKNPEDVTKWDNTKIEKKMKPLGDGPYRPRTMAEARISPFDKNVKDVGSTMSSAGQQKLEKYCQAYKQRLKSETNLSKDGKVVQRGDNESNFESLAGLKGYRVGPVCKMWTVSQAKEEREKYVQSKTKNGQENSIKSPSTWLQEENYKAFDKKLMSEFGFKTLSDATAWRKSNHLTIHEDPDGMFLVPSDVHDSVSHSGYRSAMSKCLNGKMSQEDFDAYVRAEKVAYVKHEAKVRGVRAAKGIGMAMVKNLLKDGIAITCEETWKEFSQNSDDSFVDRIKRLFRKIWEHIKKKCAHILANIKETLKNNVVGALVTELFNLLNDFVFKTAKNIFKIMRTMWRSIYDAFKIIFSSKYSWQERVFEASKIVTSGFVGVIGFSLNELIEKFLISISFPFASFISDVLSGLFASIMSCLVLMIFDSVKDKFMTQSVYVQQCMAQSKLLAIGGAQIALSSLQTSMAMQHAYMFSAESFQLMQVLDESIKQNNGNAILIQSLVETIRKRISAEDDTQKNNIQKLKELVDKYGNEDRF